VDGGPDASLSARGRYTLAARDMRWWPRRIPAAMRRAQGITRFTPHLHLIAGWARNSPAPTNVGTKDKDANGEGWGCKQRWGRVGFSRPISVPNSLYHRTGTVGDLDLSLAPSLPPPPPPGRGLHGRETGPDRRTWARSCARAGLGHENGSGRHSPIASGLRCPLLPFIHSFERPDLPDVFVPVHQVYLETPIGGPRVGALV